MRIGDVLDGRALGQGLVYVHEQWHVAISLGFWEPIVCGSAYVTISLMSGRPAGDDNVPAIADQTATLAAALARLNLQGAIFLRGEYTEAWAYDSLPTTDALAILAPELRG